MSIKLDAIVIEGKLKQFEGFGDEKFESLVWTEHLYQQLFHQFTNTLLITFLRS